MLILGRRKKSLPGWFGNSVRMADKFSKDGSAILTDKKENLTGWIVHAVRFAGKFSKVFLSMQYGFAERTRETTYKHKTSIKNLIFKVPVSVCKRGFVFPRNCRRIDYIPPSPAQIPAYPAVHLVIVRRFYGRREVNISQYERLAAAYGNDERH